MVSFRHSFPADAQEGNSGHLVLPELLEERAQPHIYDFMLTLFSVVKITVQEGAGEMTQWLTALDTLAEDPISFLRPTWQVTIIRNFVYMGIQHHP